ncbi:hypothetical protein GPUN_2450 [Glaciecola punicea ACAM 611]|uniref:Uncharacterized protein n=1 Tax=Glaciecola punicea ACAM 611 TaxID=1121923 RepID=H5TE38_9ALTE|nr:hypothetical protein GPUN_2450 [Glaciecola punicea ACAM 611]
MNALKHKFCFRLLNDILILGLLLPLDLLLNSKKSALFY